MDNQLIGVMLLCISFASPIASYRLCCRGNLSPGGSILTMFVSCAAIFVAVLAIRMFPIPGVE